MLPIEKIITFNFSKCFPVCHIKGVIGSGKTQDACIMIEKTHCNVHPVILRAGFLVQGMYDAFVQMV
jgi:hypothetical protein